MKIATDIDQINKRDPQEYWKYWKKHNKRKNVASYSEITLEEFTNHYISTHVSPEKQNTQFMKNISDLVKLHSDKYEL